jgi:hypothetical protein
MINTVKKTQQTYTHRINTDSQDKDKFAIQQHKYNLGKRPIVVVAAATVAAVAVVI